MKRRRVSPFRMGLSIFLLVFFLAGIVVFSWLLTMYHPADAAHPYDWGFVGAMSPIVACTIGLVLALYMAFKGAFSATYTVDAEGMTTYFRKHTYPPRTRLSPPSTPAASTTRSCPSWSTTAPRPGSFIAPQRRFPKRNGTISSNITKTIMRISSFSSFAMRRLIRSSLAAFRSGHATISRRKCRCMA